MPHPLLTTLYAVHPPQRTRSPGNPMQILALGMPRSGTDSLRSALRRLGYTTIWHGFEMPSSRQEEGFTWLPLLEAKATSLGRVSASSAERDEAERFLKEFEWDAMLGDCDVLMDMPPAIFWRELLEYYPQAKVIVNRRADMSAWHASLAEALKAVDGGVLGWMLWVTHWFDARLYWWYRTVLVESMQTIVGRRDFGKYGLEAGVEHYEALMGRLRGKGRDFLEWEVKQGWEPLCKFLDRAVPEEEFPWENRRGDEFKRNADRAIGKMLGRAALKMGAVVVMVGAVGYGWYSSVSLR
jgi:hypothetical protein